MHHAQLRSGTIAEQGLFALLSSSTVEGRRGEGRVEGKRLSDCIPWLGLGTLASCGRLIGLRLDRFHFYHPSFSQPIL